MAKEKIETKNIESKIKELKIELLRSPTKRGRIKKEIARLLTMANDGNKDEAANVKTVKTNAKLTEDNK